MRDPRHQIRLRRHHGIVHLPAAVDDDKAGLNREGHTGNDHHRRARAVGVNLVCAGCVAVPSSAGELSVCTVDVGEVAVTVVRADAGADERLREARAGPANAADEKAVIALKRGVASVKRGEPYMIDVITQPR